MSDILETLGQNLAQKDDTNYIVYLLFSAQTTNGLNKINQTIFKEFFLDCDDFYIKCIDKDFHLNTKSSDFFLKLVFNTHKEDSILPPCSWGGIFESYLDNTV